MSSGQQASQIKNFKQQSSVPTKKVAAGGIAGALSIVIVFALNTYVLPQPIPAEVASAITTILSFVVSYYVSPAANDQIVPQ